MLNKFLSKDKKKNILFLHINKKIYIFAIAIEIKVIVDVSVVVGELPEWLTERFAKPSTLTGRKGSNPLLSAKFGA